MVNLDKSVVVKLRKGSKVYEILADSKLALAFKNGKSVSISDVVVTEEIFYDAKKGTRASEADLERTFGTKDKLELCKLIVKEGQVPVTAEILKENLEMKRKQIVELIHKNVVDPHTGKPHPAQRIDAAITEAKIKIDENKSAEQQLQDVITNIRPIIPIKMEVRELMITFQPQYSNKVYTLVKRLGKILTEHGDNSGNSVVHLELPAGLQEELEIALNNTTKGTVDIKLLSSK